ncbi:unnamed protein product [Rotaria sp. Silwood2]|nr:unnamed protein product [Rotaria sp. Silwood2]
MIFFRKLVCFTLLHLVITLPQINLDLTDWISVSESNTVLQHDCLHVFAPTKFSFPPQQIISYCMSEWPSKWNIRENNFDQSFTFAELYKRNITSQQLYLWSAPMDIVEHYEFYLDQLSNSNKSPSIVTQLFYNCTLPRFGPLCQYSLDIYMPYGSSLYEIINNFYQENYRPMTLTCYTHLECNRGSNLACLDWTEICDGHIDCLNDGIDEEHCEQLEVNKCEESEFRCKNGECISHLFVQDGISIECIDQSDESYGRGHGPKNDISGPSFTFEDIRCPKDKGNQNLFTTSCLKQRDHLILQAMFLNESNSISDDCWFAFRCNFGIPDSSHPKCRDICLNRTCKEIINNTCPDMFFIPNAPILFGHIYLAYTKQAALKAITNSLPPQYVCYNEQLCDGFYTNKTLLLFHNATCRRPEDFPLIFSELESDNWVDAYVKPIFRQLYKCNTIVKNNNPAVCNNSFMYQCINSSKCISKHRIGDGLFDCDYGDDEQPSLHYDLCLKGELPMVFKCTSTNKCIDYKKIDNNFCDCGCDEDGLCDDEYMFLKEARRHIAFQAICDGDIQLLPITVDGRNETDETECDLWQCNNTFTRCNEIWNCWNGADEVDCEPSQSLQCPLHHHICISSETNQPMCLPLEKANDGKIDCLEGADEPRLCQSNNDIYNQNNFYCQNYTSLPCIMCKQACFYSTMCNHEGDTTDCYRYHNFTTVTSICNRNYKRIRSNVENNLRRRLPEKDTIRTVPFPFDEIKPLIKHTDTRVSFSSFIESTRQYSQRCHRGIPLRVWIDREKNLTDITCLCPPSFYGNICQYQNQRVSLTTNYDAYSDSWQTMFSIIVLLIDDSDERIIHSYQKLAYQYLQDCHTKYNTYLLYSTRPKNHTMHYSIHIDIYETISLTYRGSFLVPLKFHFLPVHRIAVQFSIPHIDDNIQTCVNQPCRHGQCIRYSEDPKGTTFCRCNQGWSGRYCTIPHSCMCSSDSLCIGVLPNNRSICVCPMHKFGSRCLIENTICQSNKNVCLNGGQCIPADRPWSFHNGFFCICPKGFTGHSCEMPDTKITVSFHKDIQLPQSMIVHFIETMDGNLYSNRSAFKTILLHQNIVTIHWAYRFNIALIQLFDKGIYIIAVQVSHNASVTFVTKVNPSDRCKHLSEILNDTIVKLHLIRRIKYYHVPCQETSPSLSCFYDDTHFCTCNNFGHHRVANCFEFDPNQKLDCLGRQHCENGGKCLQDRGVCQKMLMCLCSRCFYGTRCQFSSSGFGLSLDGILGYRILPHINIIQQPPIVQMSMVLTMIMTITGLINGILSVITFKNKESRHIGCGFYLLGSSITTLFTMTMFALKFWILIVAQISYNMNRSFLYFQCISIDFLLRIGLNMDQWLNACVAVERVITTKKGIYFNKKKSKKMAKYIILGILLLTISTNLHDPFHRRLIYDNNDNGEKRIWCVVTYSSNVQVYNSIINIFQFFSAFIINLVSSMIIIKTTAHLRSTVHVQQSYQNILQQQILQHSRILIAPIVLVILAIPRLIFSLISGCMNSVNDSWLFLAGYFISFIPPMLTFVIFVLPSKPYKKEFWKTIKKYRTMMQTHVNFNS